MPIRVECPNGHVLNAKDSHAGRTFACPACGQSVTVPTVEETLVIDPFLLTDADIVSPETATNSSSPFGAFDSAFDGLPPSALPQQAAAPSTLQQHAAKQSAANAKSAAAKRAPVRQGMPAATLPKSSSSATNRSVWALNGVEFAFIGVGTLCGSMLGLILLAGTWLVVRRGQSSLASNQPTGTATGVNTVSNDKGPGVAAKPVKINPPKEDLDAIGAKLKKIGLAWMNYESNFRRFSPPEKSELSWRVHLLPFLEQGPLYSKFHLDEPWNSPHNRSLIDFMPEVYRIPGSKGGATRIQTPVGKEMIFDGITKTRLASITDGAANTILTIVVGKDKETPWTKPDELDFAPESPFDALGSLPDRYLSVIVADGHATVLPPDIQANEFYSLLTPKGGEVSDLERLSARYAELKSNGGGVASTSPLSSKVAAAKAAKAEPETAEVRNRRMKQLRDVGLAQLNYESAYKRLPISASSKGFNSEKRANLSWRVHVLPYLDQQVLYEKFKMDEPWDSPNNIQLLDKMPEIFRDPRDPIGSTKTRLLRFTGPDTPFNENGAGPRLADFTDGISNTIAFVCAGGDKAIEWTKPEDLPFDVNAPLASVGQVDAPVLHCVFNDNSIVTFDMKIPPEIFKGYVTPRGAEIIAPNDFTIGPK